MVIPELAVLSDLALFLLRLVVAAVFLRSGWSHAARPAERGESLGMSAPGTFALGAVEVVAAAAVAVGLYPQVGAALLMGVMLGAVYKKMFVWKTGLWGDETNGWYYDLLYLVCSFVILAAGGGAITVT